MRKFNTLDQGSPVVIRLDGRPVEMPAGTPLAAGLLASVAYPEFGPLCFMGTCFQCVAVVDGRPAQRTCRILPENGMDVRFGPAPETSDGR